LGGCFQLHLYLSLYLQLHLPSRSCPSTVESGPLFPFPPFSFTAFLLPQDLGTLFSLLLNISFLFFPPSLPFFAHAIVVAELSLEGLIYSTVRPSPSVLPKQVFCVLFLYIAAIYRPSPGTYWNDIFSDLSRAIHFWKLPRRLGNDA
jgi:hypothetical protein